MAKVPVKLSSEERRLVIVPISKRVMLKVFEQLPCGRVPYLRDLPEGVEVKAVHYSFSRDCFELLLFHASFQLVPDGAEIPFWPETVEIVLGPPQNHVLAVINEMNAAGGSFKEFFNEFSDRILQQAAAKLNLPAELINIEPGGMEEGEVVVRCCDEFADYTVVPFEQGPPPVPVDIRADGNESWRDRPPLL